MRRLPFLLLPAVLMGLSVLISCQPPPPPPPRPAPPAATSAEPVPESVDPQVAQAARSDGLQGGTLLFRDDFERADLGPNWIVKHPDEWTIEGGLLRSHRVDPAESRNQGIWLQKPLPDKARIVFQARSLSPSGDTKCEVFATEQAHEAGYSIIFGGWNNTINTITRKGEHEPTRRVQSAHIPVEPQRTYTWTIVRTDNVVRWYVDGKFFLSYDDADAVRGQWFGFNNWLTDVRFDNLEVYAL